MSNLSCKQLVENIAGYLDYDLDQEIILLFEKHLDKCRECRSFVDTYKRMLSLSSNLKNKKYLTPDIRKRLNNLLNIKVKLN